MANVDAFVLPESDGQVQEEQAFPGFPGRWTPGVPQRPEAWGLDADAFEELATARGLPLERVTVDADDYPVEPATSADIVSTPSVLLPSEQSTVPGLTPDEFEEREAFDADRRRRGVEVPATFTNVEAAPVPVPLPDGLAEQRKRLAGLKVEELRELAPAGLELPAGPKDAIVDALAAAGVDAPDRGEG